jgi:4-diphosphocytidyl-2-C-methyl-D-erythritol kinase
MQIKSFAKINLGIEVLGKRDDGFHEIITLFQSIDFCDLLSFFPCKQNEIILKGDDDSISWDESNLIHKAASLLREQCDAQTGVEIHVKKNIPAGKGLGGGSSNTAMTLLALNRMWRIHWEIDALKDLGGRLGADVPYFFEGGLCLGKGKGNILYPQKDMSPFHCVLVLPSISVSTAAVYDKFRASLTSLDKDSKIIRFLDGHNIGDLRNDLEETVFRTHPQIKAIKNLIQEQGSDLTLMSGSGSAVFGLFRQKEAADEAMDALRAHSKECTALLTTGLSRTEYRKQLGISIQPGV